MKDSSAVALPQTGVTKMVWILVAAVAALLCGIAVAIWAYAQNSTPGYQTERLTRGSVTRAVAATGTVNPQLTIIVGTYVSGVIQQISCDYNTVVKRGQSCAKIDPRPYQAIVDQTKANLAIARAQLQRDQVQLKYLAAAYQRAETLARTNAISKDAYESAQSAFEQAQAQIALDEATIAQRRAALDAAQINVDYTDIVSPVDGTVVSRNVTMGQTVAASFQTPTLFLIASDLTKMQVDANVSESDIGGIVKGNRVTFTVDAYPKRRFEGTVSQVRQSPQSVQNVVTYDVVIDADNSDLALKPGLTAATRIIVEQRDDALRVPNRALRYTPPDSAAEPLDRSRVWVMRDNRPVAITIAPGLDDENYTEVLSGDLKAGDTVIVGQKDPGRPASPLPRPRL